MFNLTPAKPRRTLHQMNTTYSTPNEYYYQSAICFVVYRHLSAKMRNHLSKGPRSIFWFGGASLSREMPGACSSGQVWKLELLKSSEMCLFLSIPRKFCQILMLVQLIGYMKEVIQWTMACWFKARLFTSFNISEKLWIHYPFIRTLNISSWGGRQ